MDEHKNRKYVETLKLHQIPQIREISPKKKMEICKLITKIKINIKHIESKSISISTVYIVYNQ